MEIVVYGSQPRCGVIVRTAFKSTFDELKKIAKDLFDNYERITLADLYDAWELPCPSIAYLKIGWVDPATFESVIGCRDGAFHKFILPKTIPLYECCHTTFKPALPKSAKDAKIQKAYNVLTRAYCRYDTNEDDLADAMGEAIRYLGEVLE